MFENSRPSASNFKSFSRSLEQFFVTAGKNNFGIKIPWSSSEKFDFSKIVYCALCILVMLQIFSVADFCVLLVAQKRHENENRIWCFEVLLVYTKMREQ